MDSLCDEVLLEYGCEADRVDASLTPEAAQVVPHQVLHHTLRHHAALPQVLRSKQQLQ